jgi:hypothetical protein
MNIVVAHIELDVLWPDGRRTTVTLRIGQPYQDIELRGWRCPVSLQGLSRQPPDLGGEDSLQALLLALRFAHYELGGAILRGGRLLYPGADPSDPDATFDLETYFGNWPQSPP